MSGDDFARRIFATGNVHRLSLRGSEQAEMHERAFAKTRLATHVTKYRPLLADRTAWNKLWRREFWDAQGFRFPEGRLHEDIPITLPSDAIVTARASSERSPFASVHTATSPCASRATPSFVANHAVSPRTSASTTPTGIGSIFAFLSPLSPPWPDTASVR